MESKLKLVTFQSFEALQSLIDRGYLECDDNKINLKKVGYAYNWVVEKMNVSLKNNFNTKYPIWCWVKCYNNICPPKRKGNKVNGFDVKITFTKNKKDVFITDFKRYSFLLNNMYIPNTKFEKEKFDKFLEDNNVTSDDLKAFVRHDKYESHRTDKEFIDICDNIRKSFDRCITEESDILQGCVFRINVDEIDKIEILKDDGYAYGSLNYIRSNGERFNWIEDYYKKLK